MIRLVPIWRRLCLGAAALVLMISGLAWAQPIRAQAQRSQDEVLLSCWDPSSAITDQDEAQLAKYCADPDKALSVDASSASVSVSAKDGEGSLQTTTSASQSVDINVIADATGATTVETYGTGTLFLNSPTSLAYDQSLPIGVLVLDAKDVKARMRS